MGYKMEVILYSIFCNIVGTFIGYRIGLRRGRRQGYGEARALIDVAHYPYQKDYRQ